MPQAVAKIRSHEGNGEEYQGFCNYFNDWTAQNVLADHTLETYKNWHKSTLETLEILNKTILATMKMKVKNGSIIMH